MADEGRPAGEEPRVARLDTVGPLTQAPVADLGSVEGVAPSAGPGIAEPERIGRRGSGAAPRTADLGHVADEARIEPVAVVAESRVADLGSGRTGGNVRRRDDRRRDGDGTSRARQAPRTPPGVREVPARGAESCPDADRGGPADPPRTGTRPGAGRRRPGPRPIDPGADPVAAAREICLAMLTDRARTKHELADALRRREVPDEAAAAVLDRFDEVGLIDDAAFAGQWVRSRQRTRGLARRALAVELRRKGVDDEVAAAALAEVDPAAEEERARELVARKLRTVSADTPEQRATAARRLVGMLARKGYPGGIAYSVVREALAAHGAEEEELGTEPTGD